MIRIYGFEFVAKIHLNNLHRSNITVPDDQHITRLLNIAAYTKEVWVYEIKGMSKLRIFKIQYRNQEEQIIRI